MVITLGGLFLGTSALRSYQRLLLSDPKLRPEGPSAGMGEAVGVGGHDASSNTF